jgi:NADH:ubiquinone oxidoreductase subunit 6 (subunit J)
VSLLIIMLLIEKKQRKEWVRKQRWWIIFGWASWTAVLVSVILVADSAKKDAWWWLGDSLLRGLSALGNVVWTPWFVLFVIILAAYGRQVRDLLNRLQETSRP